MGDATARPTRRAATAFIFVTIVLDVLAMGMVIPVLPQLIQQVGGISLARTAQVFGLFGAVWAVMQLIAGPIQGALSDRFGRRPVILISNFGMGANFVLMALAPNLAWLFVGRIISGAAAGSIPAAMAYLADIKPPEERAASFGLMGAAMSLGFAIGPAVGGVLGGMDPRAPFWAAAALSLANACYGLFVLPESLPRERRAPLKLRHMNPVGAIGALVRSYPVLAPMLAVSFLFALAQQGPHNVFVIYADHRYGWGPAQIGLLMTGFGFGGMLVQMLIIPFAIKRLGERASLILGGMLQVIGSALFALAATGPQFWLGVPFGCLGAIAGPAWSAMLSRQVGPSEQGLLAGASSSVSSLTNILGPLVFTMSFSAAISGESWLPQGTPFFLAAGLMAIGIAAAARVTRGQAAAAPA